MSHHLTPAEVQARALNYKTVQPPVPTFWQLDLNDYQIPRETVSIRITPAVRIEKDGAMIDAPILEFLDIKGEVCGTLNGGFPCPPYWT